MNVNDRDGGGSMLPRSTTSKLPQLRSNRASVVLDPNVVSASLAENGVAPSRPQRNSLIAKPTVTSPTKIGGAFSPPPNKRSSMLLRPGFQTSTIAGNLEEGESKSGLMSPPPRGTSTVPEETMPTEEEYKPLRKPRPSLSDRTVETLSQIPPSPSPARRRPQSGFYNTDSPMRPPSRAMSSLGYARPSSQLGSHSATGGERPASPTKRGAATHDRSQSISIASKRAVSSDTPVKRTPSISGPKPMSRLQQPSRGLPTLPSTTRMPLAGSKTIAARPSRVKSPVKDLFDEGVSKPANTAASRTTKPGAPLGLRKAAPNGRQSSLTSQKMQAHPATQTVNGDALNELQPPKQSQSLRDIIRQAKAAQRSVSGSKGDPFMPRSIDHDQSSLSIDTDPTSLDLLDSSHVNILRKRVNNAREDGKLNIAALCLREMPIEVLKMYDSEVNEEGGLAWYESVDVTRLNAADNELEELPDEIFPSVSSPLKSDFGAEDEPPKAIFTSLEAMDFHGNQLKSLPPSLGRLPLLTSLNVSRNKLGFDSLEIISRLVSLKELKWAENSMKGTVPDCVGNMESLELLDLHGNEITDITGSLGKLSKLKVLNVSSNRLSTLPMEAIFDLPIVEINASRNRLNGSLLPSNIPQVPFLQTLDVSTNALLMLSDIKVDFPALRSLNIANNRIAVLPDLASWQNLSDLNAEENKISEIPAGFTSLKNLKHADFGNNSLLQLEDGIGSMDSLTTFNIQNNPLRERRLPRLTTEELKSELRSRITSLSPSSDRSGSLSSFSLLSRAGTSWTPTGDTLDRSSTRLKTIDKADLEPLAGESIRNLVLHHNQLPSIPASIEILGSTLTTLDLSNNKLGKSENFLPKPIILPNLQSLNLTSNALTTLTPIVTFFSAPKLATLILLFNRLTSLPTSPSLMTTFPSLSKLLASNNQINVLDVEAVRGLQVLDVSSNEIEALPPQLALLEGTLRTLMVSGNKFRVPSWGVLEKGTEEILKWCRRKIPAGEEGAIED